jgi:hypothetical protein
MNNFTFLLPTMTLIAVSVLTPWQLFQSLCPYVSAQSSQCLGTGTQQQPFTQQQQQQPFTQQQQQQQPFTQQQQQQPFTQQQQQQPFTQQQPSTTVIPSTQPQLVSPP